MKITRKFLSSLNFRVMDDHDKMGFAGVMSPVPLIAEFENVIIVLDGDHCEIISDDCEVIDNCENVRELAY